MSESNDRDVLLGGKRREKLPRKEDKNWAPLPGGRRRKNTPKDNSARMLNIIILSFIGYAIYLYFQQGGDMGVVNQLRDEAEIPSEIPQHSALEIQPLQSYYTLKDIGTFIPVKRPTVSTNILQEGSGDPILCGQQAKYRFISGVGSEREVSEVNHLQLGDPLQPTGLTIGMMGMRKGEVRAIGIPRELWDGGQSLTIEDMTHLLVELESISPDLPASTLPLRRFVARRGSGHRLRCGDLAVVNLTFWSAKGVELFRSPQPVGFILGAGQVPFGLEQGVLEMSPGGLYTMILPSETQNPLSPASPNMLNLLNPSRHGAMSLPDDIQWPEDEIVIVDIEYPESVDSKTTYIQHPLKKTPLPELPQKVKSRDEIKTPSAN